MRHRAIRAAIWACVASLGMGIPLAQAEDARQIGTHKQLFLEESLVESSHGVSFTMNTPARTGRILLKADAPWETSADGHIGAYCSVLKDGGKIRLWYDVRLDDTFCVAYAESTDGLEFAKPIVGRFPVNGSTENNIVMPGRIGGGAVWIDPHADADKRYRSQSKGYNPPTAQRLYCYHSPDGLAWTQWGAQDIGDCDTQSIAFWDDGIGRYVLYTRRNPNPGTVARSRIVRRLESDDLQHWENEQVVMQADEVDNATYEMPTPKPPVDYYGAAVFRYPDDQGFYLMLSQAYWHFNLRPREVVQGGNQDLDYRKDRYAPGTLDVRLAASSDGTHFHRLGDRKPFMTLGPEGAFDSRTVWALPNPIQMGDEVWIYYAGSNKDHDGFVDPKAASPMSGIGLATLRLDGFVSADAAYTGGQLTTKPLIFEGNRLEVNLDTGGGGSLRVELLDEAGQPIPGYTLDNAAHLYGNSVRMPVTWTPLSELAPLAGKPIRIRFTMRDCRLYAFQFVAQQVP